MKKSSKKEINYAKWGWISLAAMIVVPMLISWSTSDQKGDITKFYDLLFFSSISIFSVIASFMFFKSTARSKFYLLFAIPLLIFALFFIYIGYLNFVSL